MSEEKTEQNTSERQEEAAKSGKSKYDGLRPVEAKLMKLADAAKAAYDALVADPVYAASRKARLAPCVSTKFYEEDLESLHEAIARVDNIVHGWELQWVDDAAADESNAKRQKKYASLKRLDVSPKKCQKTVWKPKK